MKAKGTGKAKAGTNGRPPKITVETVRAVAGWMAKGMTEEQACWRVGVNPATFGPAVCRRPALAAVMEKEKVMMLGHALDWLIGVPGADNPIPIDLEWSRVAFLLERRWKKGGQFSRMEMQAGANAQGEASGELTEKEMLILEHLVKTELRAQVKKHA